MSTKNPRMCNHPEAADALIATLPGLPPEQRLEALVLALVQTQMEVVKQNQQVVEMWRELLDRSA